MANQDAQPDIPHELHKIISDRPFLTPSTEPAYDSLLGIGYSLRLGVEGALRLDVFPQRKVLRVHSSLLSFEIKEVTHVERQHDKFQVTSEADGVSAIVEITEQGTISFVSGFDNPDALQFPHTPNVIPAPMLIEEDVTALAAPTRQGQEKPGEEKLPRMTLTGTIAGEPRYGMTKKKHQPITQFPLAVVDEEQQTTWVSIVLFGAKTDYVREKKLRVGDKVEVIGYPHKRAHTHRENEAMEVMEIYGTALRPLPEK